MGEAMADVDFIHIAEIMKAALPYVDIKTKITMNLLTTLFDFLHCYHSFKQPPDLAACGCDEQEMNVEGLLNAIRPLCQAKERNIVDKILGIFNAKRMIEMYSTYMDLFQSMGGFDGEAANDSGTGNASDANASGFDFSSLFANLFRNNDATGNSTDNHSSDNNENNPYSDSTGFDPDAFDDVPSGDGIFSENAYASKTDNNYTSSNTNASDIPPVSESGSSNMINMLKSMIPPEKMDTFENLSMLLNTMSYDSNNKTDHSEGA